MLMEHETSKLKDLDEEYATELREWKAQLKPRKQVTRRSKISWVTVMSKNRVALCYDVCPSLCRLDLYLALFLPYSRARPVSISRRFWPPSRPRRTATMKTATAPTATQQETSNQTASRRGRSSPSGTTSSAAPAPPSGNPGLAKSMLVMTSQFEFPAESQQ